MKTTMKLVTVWPKAPLRYAPEAWNNDRVGDQNCLAYALDEKELGWPTFYSRLSQAGLTSDQEIRKAFATSGAHHRHPDIRPQRLSRRDAMDMHFHVLGLERIRKHAFDPARQHIVAFYFDQLDHFYRLDASGSWSHKPGAGDVTNKDAYGDVLEDIGRARLLHERYATKGRAAESDLRYYRVMNQPTVWAVPAQP